MLCLALECGADASKVCRGCGIGRYCSVECQKSHWGIHKKHCKGLKSIESLTSDCKLLLVYLHGVGDTMRGFEALAKRMNIPNSSYVILEAPNAVLDLGFCWFDGFDAAGEAITSNNPAIESRTPQVEDSRIAILATLHKFYSRNPQFSYDNTVVIGFGQGGTMAVDVAGFRDFPGVVSFSGDVFIPETGSPVGYQIPTVKPLLTVGKLEELSIDRHYVDVKTYPVGGVLSSDSMIKDVFEYISSAYHRASGRALRKLATESEDLINLTKHIS